MRSGGAPSGGATLFKSAGCGLWTSGDTVGGRSLAAYPQSTLAGPRQHIGRRCIRAAKYRRGRSSYDGQGTGSLGRALACAMRQASVRSAWTSRYVIQAQDMMRIFKFISVFDNAF